MQIRDAVREDVEGIRAIYNEVIANSTAIYEYDPVPMAERLGWFDARRESGFPVLVAEDASGIVGFSSYGAWRPRIGYSRTVEHSVHVRADRRGRGIGRQLIEALFPLAERDGFHVMIGHIDAEAEASLSLHEKLGFRRVGRFPEVAWKFGRWLDLVAVQRPIA
jgi:phosphinothricin acetyltransferase